MVKFYLVVVVVVSSLILLFHWDTFSIEESDRQVRNHRQSTRTTKTVEIENSSFNVTNETEQVLTNLRNDLMNRFENRLENMTKDDGKISHVDAVKKIVTEVLNDVEFDELTRLLKTNEESTGRVRNHRKSTRSTRKVEIEF